MPELQEDHDRAKRVKEHPDVLVVIGNLPYNGFASMALGEEREAKQVYKEIKQEKKPKVQGLNDLYVRFFRMVERRIAEMTGRGIIFFISTYSWLDNLSFTGITEPLLDALDAIRIGCLNADKYKTGKITPVGDPDPSVFSAPGNPVGFDTRDLIPEQLLTATERNSRLAPTPNRRRIGAEIMEIEDLIIDDRQRGIFRVNRTSMTSIDLFQRERELIFNRCWIYLGHESEVENPGDYRRRVIAGRPLFFSRGKDGQVRVFLNSCTHRGALICRRDAGNAEVLQCFYHAWSFNTNGELIGVPGEDAYGPYFDRSELGLKEPPRVENYRGFYFVCFNPYVEDLVTYLAGAKDYLDLIVDQSEEGMRVVSGSNKYTMKANWKLLVENSLDGYHLIPTHQTYLDYISSLGTDESGETMATRLPGGAKALGNGHCVIETAARNGRPIAHWHPLYGADAKEPMARVRQRLVEKYGEDRTYRMADTSRNLIIYPNLVINDIMAITIRYFEPLAPDNMEVTAWHLVPREESDAMLATRLDSFLTFLGPGGFATPDDVEALESCQAGFRASETEWSDISRGMLRPIPQSSDELQMRGFWRQWHANMQGLSKTDVQDGQPSEMEAALATDD